MCCPTSGSYKSSEQILVVCEATGGYERHVLDMCCARGLDVHRAHGSRTRAFASYRGFAAKTDAIDAKMLAHYGADTPNLRLYQPVEPELEALRHLRKRRDDIILMSRMEQNRLQMATNSVVKRSIAHHVRALDKEREQIEQEIDRLLSGSPQLNAKAKLIQSIKGVGPQTAQACLAYLPELGALSKGQVASLVGLAPNANDSGKFKGKRHIGGGRKAVRATLYMAAVVAIKYNQTFKAIAQNMRQRGKPNKLIITAIMRRSIVIINAVVKSGEPCRQKA
ncbi:MAG: IS110 family transposase [Rhizobiaceae bacterium]